MNVEETTIFSFLNCYRLFCDFTKEASSLICNLKTLEPRGQVFSHGNLMYSVARSCVLLQTALHNGGKTQVSCFEVSPGIPVSEDQLGVKSGCSPTVE